MLTMRRVYKDRKHSDGYEWLRFQESKLLTFFCAASLLTLAIPLLIGLSVGLITYLAHAFFVAIIVRHSLTLVDIA